MSSPAPSTASEIIKAKLAEWGLAALYGDVDRLIKEGLGADAIDLQLQATDAWRKRFAGNEERKKRGLSVLSPAEYVAVEAGYRRVMQSYGLPQGFWDDPQTDFVSLIGRDVSPEEVNQRVSTAQEAFLSADDQLRQTWREFYGLSDGAGIAALLDPDRAMPIVNRMATAAKAGAAASRNGLAADRDRLERYADQGFTADQLRDAFSTIGQTYGTEAAQARRFGADYSQADAEAARVQGTASARRKQLELAQSEQALFDNRAAANDSSLNRRTSGRY